MAHLAGPWACHIEGGVEGQVAVDVEDEVGGDHEARQVLVLVLPTLDRLVHQHRVHLIANTHDMAQTGPSDVRASTASLHAIVAQARWCL